MTTLQSEAEASEMRYVTVRTEKQTKKSPTTNQIRNQEQKPPTKQKLKNPPISRFHFHCHGRKVLPYKQLLWISLSAVATVGLQLGKGIQNTKKLWPQFLSLS